MEEVLAPMPGSIIEVMVNVGDEVKEDDELLILEAMKMEKPDLRPGRWNGKRNKGKGKGRGGNRPASGCHGIKRVWKI